MGEGLPSAFFPQVSGGFSEKEHMKAFWAKRIKAWGRRLLKEESGQSIAEYVLILFIVVLIAVKVKKTLKDNLGEMLEKTGQKMSDFGNDEDF